MTMGDITQRPLSRRRLVASAGMAVPVAALLSACGGSGGAQTSKPASLAPATIGWDTFRGFTPATEWPKQMADSFMAKYPNIKVEARPIALENGNQQSAYPKMLAMAQAGTLGEVHAWDPSHWQLYQAVKRGIIRPVDEYIARDKFDLKQYYQVFIEYQKWQGKTWGLPSWGWTGQDGLLYNTEMAQQAGVTWPSQNSPDWTMSKLYEIVVKTGNFAAKTGGFGLSTTLPGAPGVTVLARAFNGDSLSPDGKKSTMTDTNSKEGMKWVYDLAHKEKVIAVPGKFEGTTINLFVNGNLGIYQDGSLGVVNVNNLNKNGLLKFKSQLFPKRKDGKRPSQLRGGTWNILGPNNKYPDHAWEFVKHITNREAILTFNTIGGNTSVVRPDIFNDPFFSDPNFKNYLENFENAMLHIIPSNLRGTELDTAYGEKGTPWYKGDVGFEDGLKAWNDECQRVLDMPSI